MKSIPLHVTKCKRCGKPVSSSISGMFNELGGICKDCITPKEHHQILLQQGKKIIASK